MFSPVCYLTEQDIIMASASAPLRIGYVPEHFSTPIYFAKKHFGLDADLIPFPSGTGHMITSLRAGDIDVGIGLTEGWVAGLGKEESGDGGYQAVGTFVESPLCKFQASYLVCLPRYPSRYSSTSLVLTGTCLRQAGPYPQAQNVPRSRASNPSKAERSVSRASARDPMSWVSS